MAKNIWAETGMSVVILPSGDYGDNLFEIARTWTQLKLLSPAVWVKHEWLVSETTNPPSQQASVLGTNKSGGLENIKADLFELLARQQLITVRLIAVRSISNEFESDEKQEALVDLLDKYVTLSLPMPISRDNNSEKYTVLHKLNLITHPTEFESRRGTNLVSERFTANFIAAAEDRSAPLAGDAFIRADGRDPKFLHFTMMHVASLGGIWSGLPIGASELLDSSVQLGTKSYVSRVFVSAILADGLTRRAAARVLRRAGNPLETGVDFSTSLPVAGTVQISPEAEADYVEAMVKLVFEFDSSRLAYSPFDREEKFTPRGISLLRTLQSFLAFSWGKLIRIPYYAAIWVIRKFVRAMNKVFFGGSDSADVAIQEPIEHVDKRDLAIQRLRESVSVEKERADRAIKSPFTPTPPKSTPTLWARLRDLVFGMLDASNLGTFGFTKGENGWPIFYQVSKVFSDPENKLDLDLTGDEIPDKQVTWVNAIEAKQLLEELSREAEDLERQYVAVSDKTSLGAERVARLRETKEDLEFHLAEELEERAQDETSQANVPEGKLSAKA